MFLTILIILVAVGIVLIYLCYLISGMIELCDNLRVNNINLLKEYTNIRNQFSHFLTKFQEQSYYLNTLCTMNGIEQRKKGFFPNLNRNMDGSVSFDDKKLNSVLEEANQCINEQLQMKGDNGNGEKSLSEKNKS